MWLPKTPRGCIEDDVLIRRRTVTIVSLHKAEDNADIVYLLLNTRRTICVVDKSKGRGRYVFLITRDEDDMLSTRQRTRTICVVDKTMDEDDMG